MSTDGTLKKRDGWTLNEIEDKVVNPLQQERNEESCICQVCEHTQSHRCLVQECVCCSVPAENPIWTLDISPDGKLIASGSFDKTVKIWDVNRGIELGILHGHEDQIWGCAFFPDGKRLVSASWDSTLKIWDLTSLISNQQITGRDNTKRTIRNRYSEVKQWLSSDLEIPSSSHNVSRCAQARPIDLTGPILCAAISLDSRLIVSASWDGWLRRWQIDTGIELSPMRAHKGYITALTFLPPNGKSLLICDDEGHLKLFDTDKWKVTTRFQAHKGQITACSFSHDGKYILSASRDRTLKRWELNGDGLGLHQCKILVKQEENESVESCAFSYNNEWIAGWH